MTWSGPGTGSLRSATCSTSGGPKRRTSMARMTSGHLAAVAGHDVACREARMLGVDVEREDPARVNPDDLRRQVPGRIMRPDGVLRLPPDLEEVRPLHGRLGHFVHHEGDVRVSPH